jgi:hypothetical protein
MFRPSHDRTPRGALERAGAAAGVLYVVLVLVGVNAFPKGSSGVLAPAGDVARDVARHPADAGFWTGILLEGAGLLLLMFFLARLWGVLRASEPAPGWLSLAAFGAGIVSVAVKLGSFPLGTVAYYEAREGLDPALAATLVHANDIGFVMTWAVDGAFLAAVAAVVLRTGALPRWAGWTAAALAPLLLGSVIVATSESAQMPTALLLLWIVAVSVHLLRADSDAGRAARSTASRGRIAGSGAQTPVVTPGRPSHMQ